MLDIARARSIPGGPRAHTAEPLAASAPAVHQNPGTSRPRPLPVPRLSPASSPQNPFYPVMVQRDPTRLTVCLSTRDQGWQVDQRASDSVPAVGYYVLRLVR